MSSVETILCTDERIRQRVGELDSILTLPEVAARIIETVNDPNSRVADLHRIIGHDPALVSRVLQRVNSSFYGRPTRVDSVERAIVLLGFETVHDLAVSATISGMFNNVSLCDEFGGRDLWVHSVAVAAAARAMARMFCKPLAEPAFLAGLVHDVGLLAELQVCPAKVREVCTLAKCGPARFGALELATIGCDHAEIGGALAARWGFPDFCRAAAAYHHHPALADPEQRRIVAFVYVADTLCCQDAIGFDLTAREQLADEVASNDLVPLDVIDHARENLSDLVSDAILTFSV